MFPKYDNKMLITSGGGMRSEYRTYESYILNYLDEKNLLSFKLTTKELFRVIPNNTLVSIYKKIKKNPNKPDFVEDILLENFDKYKVKFVKFKSVPKKRKIARKKENKDTVNSRVKRFRNKTKKLTFQCLINPDLQKQLLKNKKEKNFTYEQLLQYLVN